jgi:site-specific recombinase XerD
MQEGMAVGTPRNARSPIRSASMRTGVKDLVTRAVGITTLQELMGHKKKETTLKYIHLAKTNLRQEMSQTAL